MNVIISTVCRLGLAGLWIASGVAKAMDPGQTYIAVAAFDVLPDQLTSTVAAVLPYLELGLGLLLLLGVGTRAAAALSVAVLVAFVAGIVQAWARGLSIDCGCFGGGGQVSAGRTEYPMEIARDLGFLALALVLVRRPATRLSADGLLARHSARSASPVTEGK
ncbi:MauE/DoxX family redox-associated membrane protein [Streptomyces sviceus]|uniref:MauE/DoxX family redox-associated membrane protein n=1 Tax=Streptomyces sviceus TaxID=285530 RepID=UPI00368269BD